MAKERIILQEYVKPLNEALETYVYQEENNTYYIKPINKRQLVIFSQTNY